MDHPFLPGLCERILQQTAACSRGSWWPDGVLAGSTPSPHHHLIKQHTKASSQPPAQLLLGGHFLGARKCPISKSLSSISLFTVHAWELVVIRLLTRVRVFVTPWTAARQASRSFTIFRSLLKFMSVASVMLSKHLILCHPLLLLPSVFPSVRDFSHESSLYIRWSKYWRFSFSISHSDEYSGLISFRIDWFDLLAVQGTLKSLLQHHGSKASILWCSASLWSSSHIRT